MQATRGWRPALRIARRDVVRARGRSALVMAMVGLPVALVTTLATVLVTNEVSPAESLPLRLGATQAELMSSGAPQVFQDPTGQMTSSSGEGTPPPPPTAASLQALTGGTVLDLATASTSVRTERGRLVAEALAVDASDPRLAGIIRLFSGRLPQTDTEVLVNRELQRSGYKVGSTIALADGESPATVVGVIRQPNGYYGRLVIARPGLGLVKGEATAHRYLLDRAEPLLWPEVRRLNAEGITVFSRAVVQDPPADWRDAMPPEQFYDSTAAADRAVLVLIVFSVVLEVVLLAGPAFAVGVRRQSRQLALVAATGGTARDVRRVVLAQALVLGVGAATIGAVLGIVVAAALVAVLPRVTPLELGPWQVDWRYVGAAFALGALASLLAAFLPAIAASRSNVVAVLAGRRGDAPARRGWPVLGAVLIAAGTAAVLTLGTRQGGEFVVAGGTLTMVIGAIVAMPWIIGAVGRLGSHLPLPLRLATRDSARQRARTAPAVAAVMAAVAGLTTLAVGFSSDFEQSRREYQPRHPAGVTTVSAYSADERTWRSVDSAAARDLPGRPLLPYGTLGRSMATGTGPMTAVYVRRPGCPATPPRETVQGQFHCYDWMFDGKAPASWGGAGPLVATPEALAALGYRLDATQRSVLDAGGVLLPAESLAARGRVTLTTYKDDGITTSDVQNHDVKAGYLPPRRNGGTVEVLPVVLTPAAAEAMGLEWSRTGGVLAQSATPLGKDAQDRLEESLRGVTGDLELYTERGFVQSRSLPLLALFGTAVLVVLVGTLTATGLALNDSRPDLATLASVGAKPRTRRIMAAAQALVIGLLGAVTGVLVGLVPGIAVAFPLTSQGYNPSTGMSQSGSPTIVVPWLLLLVVALAVPALAAATAGIGVRSKLPLTRRLGQ